MDELGDKRSAQDGTWLGDLHLTHSRHASTVRSRVCRGTLRVHTADAAKPHDEGLGLVLSKLNIQGGSVQCHKSSGIPEPESSPSTDQSDFIADISISPNGSQTNVRTFKLTR